MNLPNKITLSRIFMIPVFAVAFYLTVLPFNFIVAAGIFALASFTDFLDGAIARKRNLVTAFGKFLDPIADKVLVSTALILILVPPASVSVFDLSSFNIPEFLPAVCVALIMARELIISGFRLVAAGNGKVIAADKSGKIKTFFTDVAIVWILVFMNFNLPIFKLIGFILLALSTLLTVYSGVECLVKNKEVIEER